VADADDAVALVDVDKLRPHRPGLGIADLVVSQDDDDVTFVYQPGSSAIHVHDAATSHTLDGVGLQSHAIVYVKDVHLLEKLLTFF